MVTLALYPRSSEIRAWSSSELSNPIYLYYRNDSINFTSTHDSILQALFTTFKKKEEKKKPSQIFAPYTFNNSPNDNLSFSAGLSPSGTPNTNCALSFHVPGTPQASATLSSITGL